MPSKDATVSVRANNRKLRGDLQKSKRNFMNLFADIKKGAGSVLGGLGAFGAVSGIQSITGEVLDFEKTLTRIAIQGGDVKQLDSLRDTAKGLAKEFGLSQLEVARGLDTLVNLQGVAGLSADKLRVLAMASNATGANMKDLSGTVFALQNAFGLTGPGELEKALGAVVGIGKAGSIPLTEMNTILQQGATLFSRFSDTGVRGTAQLAASFQVLRTGFGSAAEAQTGLKALLNQIEASESKLQGFGIKVRGPDKKLRPLFDILGDIEKKGLQNKKVFSQVFGSAEARQATRVLIDQKNVIEELTAANVENNTLQKDNATWLQSNAGRQQLAFARAKQALVDMATPERIEKFTQALETMASGLEWAVDHADTLLKIFIAWKAANFAQSILKAANSLSQLGSAAAAASASQAGGGVLGGLIGGGGKGGKGGKGGGLLAMGGKILGGASALISGVEVGMAIDAETEWGRDVGAWAGVNDVHKKRKEIRKERARQKRIAPELDAIQQLLDANVLDTQGIISQDIVLSMRRKEMSGQELTPVEQAAKQALGETGLASTEAGAFGFAKEIVMALQQTPEQLARQQETVLAANAALTEALQKLQAELEAQRTGQDVNIEMDGQKVGSMTRNNKSKRKNEKL